MQTPKTRKSSSEVAPQKVSPRSGSSETTQKKTARAVRQLKATELEPDFASSSTQLSKTPKIATPKVNERRSPKSPVAEKKRIGRVVELESQIAKLQEDLKQAKDRLTSSESWRKQEQEGAEDLKNQLSAVSLKLDESKQLLTRASSEKAPGVFEPQNLSGEKAWQLNLGAIQEQHSMDSTSLASAMNEMEKLKVQFKALTKSEATLTRKAESAESELRTLKEDMSKNLSSMEDMRNQLNNSKDSESKAQALVSETLLQVKTAKTTILSLELDRAKASDEYSAAALELDRCRARVNLLEGLVNKLKSSAYTQVGDGGQSEGGMLIEAETLSLKSEVVQLRSALEKAEIKYQEEQTRCAMEIKSAYELVEQMKSDTFKKESDFEVEFKKSKTIIDDLRANLMDKETELQGICEENEILNRKLDNARSVIGGEDEPENILSISNQEIENLKSSLAKKEAYLKKLSEENERLRREIRGNKDGGDSGFWCDLELARASELEASTKLRQINEEVDEGERKVARVTKQLEAAQAVGLELEAEMRRLKVQSDQWRKAAEAAVATISTGNNDNDNNNYGNHDRKFTERASSWEISNSPMTGNISSPYSQNQEDDFGKRKKNGNFLKKIGVLWKKPQAKTP